MWRSPLFDFVYQLGAFNLAVCEIQRASAYNFTLTNELMGFDFQVNLGAVVVS